MLQDYYQNEEAREDMDEIKIRSIIEFMQVPRQVFTKDLYAERRRGREGEQEETHMI